MTSPAPGPLCVVGSINVDISVTVDQLPVPGETVRGVGPVRGAGGKGANQAAAAARLGAAVRMLGAVGDDADGRAMLENLDWEKRQHAAKLDKARRTFEMRLAQAGKEDVARRMRDNDEGGRQAILDRQASLGMHSALTSAQSVAGLNPPMSGLRPTSGTLRQAVSAPVLPPLREAPKVDEVAQRRRANERARASLRSKFRDFQAASTAGLGADATKSTDAYFRLRDDARANRPPPRDPLPTYALAKTERRKRVERPPGFGKMFSTG